MEEEAPYKQLLEKRRDPYGELLSTARFLCVLLAVLVCFVIFFTQILIGVKVYGPSMQPTLETGDYLFVCTLTQPEHGDIVVVPNPNQSNANGKYLIKRVIGLPGDTIMAEDGILYSYKLKPRAESDKSILNVLLQKAQRAEEQAKAGKPREGKGNEGGAV